MGNIPDFPDHGKTERGQKSIISEFFMSLLDRQDLLDNN
jgi:hypothetical protein